MEYTVVRGDTLGKIARQHGTSVAAILSSNPSVKDPGRISVGQRLRLPEPLLRTTAGGGPRPTVGRSTPGPAGVLDTITLRISEILGAVSARFNLPAGEAPERATTFDRKRFFDGYRAEFGKLKQGQVSGLEQLLGFIEADANVREIPVIAYMLATVKHETAHTFQPIAEYGAESYFDRYDPVRADTEKRRERAKEHGNTEEGDGYKYRGRGYVQITWKNNYKALSEAAGCDLVSKPDKALEPDVAYKIMSHGMRRGVFTGHKIGDHVGGGKTDYFNARQVINAHDEAETIKGYAEKFEKILRNSVNP